MTTTYTTFTSMFPRDTKQLTPEHLKHEWTLRGNFSLPLAAGLMEGFYKSRNFYIERTKDYSYEDLYGKFEEFVEFDEPTEIFSAHNRLGNLNSFLSGSPNHYNRKTLTGKLGIDVYTLILNEFLWVDVPGRIVAFVFNTEMELREFLQGILTMTQAFNVSPSDIIAVAPFKGNQDFDIQGIEPLPSII